MSAVANKYDLPRDDKGKIPAYTHGLFLLAIIDRAQKGKDSITVNELIDFFMEKLPGMLDLQVNSDPNVPIGKKLQSDVLYHTLPALKASGLITLIKKPGVMATDDPWYNLHIAVTGEGRELAGQIGLSETTEMRLAART